MALNKQQQAAVDSRVDQDVVISAGAGSGKTFTLSKKIGEMIERGDIKPSELLVLTFTNNAAKEMKDRIIAQFPTDSKNASEMLSAHVQTFDSFNQYLVQKYAGRLGISDAITVADESILNCKKVEFLDDILFSYYSDEEKRNRLVKSISKFSTNSDSDYKAMILDFYEYIDKKLPKNREEYFKIYDDKYLNWDKYLNLREKWFEYHLSEVETAFKASYNLFLLNEQYKDNAYAFKSLLNSNDFIIDELPDKWPFDSKRLEEVYQDFLSVKNSNDIDEFIDFIKRYRDTKDDTYRSKIVKNQRKKPVKNAIEGYDLLPMNAKADFKRLTSFRDDIHLMFEIEEELRSRVENYMLTTNSFTFSFISEFALKLLTDERYEDVAEEVRNQFDYIMVDEYQDTSDIQEAFLDSLTSPRKDNTRAHIFCVGDAKQAIYAFRNSKVELFNNRLERYTPSTDEHYVIAMNTNYRSKKEVLSDINHIFKKYMRIDHGSIDYLNPREQLMCGLDDGYKPRNNEYGIRRIEINISDNKNAPIQECMAIINDIKKKIDSHYLVEAKGKIHECKYSDFAILMRDKKKYSLYKRLFLENNIPLNTIESANLKEIDSIILLQSVISLLNGKINGLRDNDCDYRHLYYSIARSYAFSYSDEEIYKVITGDDFYNNDLFKEFDEFIKKHRDASFESIFRDVLNEFHIIDRLYLIGEVEDNIAKIESLHKMVISEAELGEGISEFVKLFKTVNKKDLDLEANTISEMENAVSLMTIHASKGLEMNIVYMPYSSNKKGGGRKNDYCFDDEYGILLKDYEYDIDQLVPPDMVMPHDIYTTAYRLSRSRTDDPEMDEHVRLFYVALTRARNSLVIVGSPKNKEDSEKRNGTLYGMLDEVKHTYRIPDDLLSKIEKVYPTLSEKIEKYRECVLDVKNGIDGLPSSSFKSEEEYDIYCGIKNHVYNMILKALKSSYKELLSGLLELLIIDHKAKYDVDNFDLNIAAHIYSMDDSVKTFDDLQKKSESNNKTNVSYMNEIDEDEENDKTEDSDNKNKEYDSDDNEDNEEEIPVSTDDELMKKVTSLYYKLFDSQSAIANPTINFEPDNPNDIKRVSNLFSYYLHDNEKFKCKFRVELDYSSDEYPDIHEAIDTDSLSSASFNPIKPQLRKLTESNEEIKFEKRIHKRASIQINEDEEPLPDEENAAFGSELHRILQIVSFDKRDLSFVKDDEKRHIVERILNHPLLKDLGEKDVHKEFSYMDDVFHTNGSIDLLVVKDGKYTIIDYKTSKIDKEGYDNQLLAYRRNVSRIFKVDENDIDCYLLSLMSGKTRQVK